MRARDVVVIAAVSALGVTAARANPVITEVAWAGDPTSNSGTDEWIEIFNPDGQPIDLADFTLIGAGSVGAAIGFAVGTTLNDGDFFVVENTANVPPADGAHALVTPSISLTDGGEALCLCPVAISTCGAGCDIANPSGAAWFAGKSTAGARRTMERKPGNPDGALSSSWQDGSPSSPLAPSPGGGEGEGEGEGAAGEGEGEGAPPPDAGPNDGPSLSLSAPSGASTDSVVTVVYSASDPDVGDAVSVDLFWSADGSGNAGVIFAQGLPGGTSVSHDFDTAGVPPGVFHIFGRARDTRGAEAFAYAPGTVQVGAGDPTAVTFKLTKPNGVNDVADDGSVAVTWDVALPDGISGSIALFSDTDDRGADGTPVAGGISAAADGPRAFKWTGAPPGDHFIYGVLTHSAGTATSYAPASVHVAPAGGCTCTDVAVDAHPSLLAVGSLAILATRFKRQKRRCATG